MNDSDPEEPKFTNDERKKLRIVLKYAADLEQEGEYRRALKLIGKKWKTFVVSIAVFLTALTVIIALIRDALERASQQ